MEMLKIKNKRDKIYLKIRPKTLEKLSRLKLEQFFLETLHREHEQTHRANNLEDKIEKALEKIQLIIDLGFDYDGLNKVESLKDLIDELVAYARESKTILEGETKWEKIILN